MLHSFLTPFLTILLAEMLDKSQLALIFLSTKTREKLLLFLGSMAAFAVVDGLAVLFGSFVATLVPEFIVTWVAGIAFIIFGLLSFRSDTDESKKTPKNVHNPFTSAFLLIFVAEWADKTQLASAAFATQFHPLFVFLGVMCAMAVLSLLAIFVGSLLASKINKDALHKLAGIAFIGVGLYLLIFP